MAVIAYTANTLHIGQPQRNKIELERLRVEVDRIATAIGAGQDQTDLQRVRDNLAILRGPITVP